MIFQQKILYSMLHKYSNFLPPKHYYTNNLITPNYHQLYLSQAIL